MLTSQLRSSRPRRGPAASQVHSGGSVAPSGPLRRFPFVLAALVAMVVAAFVLFGGATRDASEPLANPWSDPAGAPERVPATPSRGAMGVNPRVGSPQPVSARTAP